MNNDSPHLFIVEGPDCSGKSTLCNTLQQLYGGTLLHITYFKEQKDIELQFLIVQNYLNAWIANPKKIGTLILDRFVGSNIVYSYVFKNTKFIENKEDLYDSLNTAASYKMPVTFINCLPRPKEKYLDNYVKLQESSGRQELYGLDVKGMEEIYNQYEVFWQWELTRLHRDITVRNFDMFRSIKNESLGASARDMKAEVVLYKKLANEKPLDYWAHIMMKDKNYE